MVNRTRYYKLPDYETVTKDVDVYVDAWRKLAEPLEKALGLKLHGFDPTYQFVKGNQQGQHVVVELPVWFVRDLSECINGKV